MSDMQFSFAPCAFYLAEMRRLIEMQQEGHLSRLAFPIFSFFSGERTNESCVPIATGHVGIFFEQEMQTHLQRSPLLLLQWVEIMYGYFWQMAATPDLAREIWMPLWSLLEMLQKAGVNTFPAMCQMAAWAASYDSEKKAKALRLIKAYPPVDAHQAAKKSLFLSTKINDANTDQIDHITYAYQNSRYLTAATDLLQAHIHYFCNVRAERKLLLEIVEILEKPALEAYKQGKMSLLGPLCWTLFQHNRYDDLLFVLKKLKGHDDTSPVNVAHAFLLPTHGEKLSFLSKSERVTFEDKDNGESYSTLIALVNRLNKVAISMLGEEEANFSIDKERFGTPNTDEDFERLNQAVADHYRLHNDIYREIKLMSLLPSHNHPLQGALCARGIVPPLISVSLEDLADEPETRQFIFFLSSHTFTHDLEVECIKNEFGGAAKIITDPSRERFLAEMNDDQNTHVYISAHGQYDHWEDHEDHIYFSEASIIPVAALRNVRHSPASRRTILLNVCDGGTSPLSFNFNNQGLAASLAAGNQVVVSHLWPVKPLYAAAFGMLMLKELQAHSAEDAALTVCRTLRHPNLSAAATIERHYPSFKAIAQALRTTTLVISGFEGTGSLSIYS